MSVLDKINKEYGQKVLCCVTHWKKVKGRLRSRKCAKPATQQVALLGGQFGFLCKPDAKVVIARMKKLRRR